MTLFFFSFPLPASAKTRLMVMDKQSACLPSASWDRWDQPLPPHVCPCARGQARYIGTRRKIGL